MIGAAALAIFSAPLLAPPLPWASGFAPEGSWAYVADMDGDGYADLVRIQPNGDAFIDISFNVDGMKAGHPDRALSNWGKDCQAAAVGLLDESGCATVVGVFAGDTLRMARCDRNDKFTDVPDWSKLPIKVKRPHASILGHRVLVWDEVSGRGYGLDSFGKNPLPLSVPGNVVSIQSLETAEGKPSMDCIFEFRDGTVKRGPLGGSGKFRLLGKVAKGQNALVAGSKTYLDTPADASDSEVKRRPESKLPPATSIWASGDVDRDGDADLFQFRFGKEEHTANDVLMYRTISPGESDSDHDGLSNAEEDKIGSDPYNPQTAGDGLLDGWKVNGFRGLDMKALGCNPRQVDLICLISRYSDVDEKFAKDTFEKVKAYYKSLPVKNPDGTSGWNLHPIFIAPVTGDDMKNPWWANRDKFLPAKWKGVVHWMQIGRGGGGQADELGDGGGCGGGGMALYATFIHEFGHQLGLSHNGFYNADGCPSYPSLMNYPYSYTLNGDIKNIDYSDGRLANFVLKETDLDEVIPLPYEKVKFLENAPYRFHLKKNGETTLIDWNWNGVFGEHHVKADVNYAYSTSAGRRDDIDRTQTAPWLFTHKGKAYILFGRDTAPVDKSADPTLGPTKTGALYLRRLDKPFKWEPAHTVDYWGAFGDPVAASFGGKIVVAYQCKQGIVVRDVDDSAGGFDVSKPDVVEPDNSLVPTIGEFDHRLWLFLWDPATQKVQVRAIRGGKTVPQVLGERSTIPVGPCEDTIHHQLILGMAQDQPGKRTTHWQIRRFSLKGGTFVGVSVDWIQGVDGDARGRSRPVVLFDSDRRFGPEGKVYFYSLGDHGKENPWACGYVAETIADKKSTGGHVQGGWIVKRFYDEWTQSRSAIAAAFFGGDILYAYRWVDGGQGDSDNHLHVGYRGTGIENTPMGDFDDLGYMKTFGIQHCILYLNRDK
ncbi:MAG: hypothetical protein P4L46_07315 [Fimbriimonas sp.]|nr:hypothetical protein [Fimbriimonas sp.]